ncbi:undecaprenyl-diphosphate phosphatase [Reinekea marinisedimentorum]|uniref:Undecaprenyl-diphosphatase n=1 Tax=Reinekea marinisedimentorum TaxID=230495 RepID=A0A4R3IAF6_9GAMM|nr:undecaprenyl-diphosphate phosphatase [Reinekea marinisedimentorum]TCS41350.1 undecaprenyl-diphosphatase [Reinekea marinisedimentorum]
MISIQWIVLAIIQGVTEFLPISSSAHLILPAQILGWADQGLAFDVAVHVGSLLAVIIYFRKALIDITANFFLRLAQKPCDSNLANQGWLILIGTIPAVIFGFLMEHVIETYLRSILVIAMTTTLFGLLLWFADVKAKQVKSLDAIGWKEALAVGFAQALALIPGTSRSGITMTAGLLLGMHKVDAARFSFLLSIPLILAAGTLKTIELLQSPSSYDIQAIAFGSVLSFISAFACIVLFLKWIERSGFLPFVVYRLALGAVLFYLYFS